MAHVAKKTRTRWILKGRVVPAGTPGAEKETRESEFYYAFWREGGVLKQVQLKGCTNKRAANERLNELLRGLPATNAEETAHEEAQHLPLRDYLDGYLEVLRKRMTRDSRYRVDKRRLERFVGSQGGRTLATLRADRDEGLAVKGKSAGAKTLANAASTFNGFLKFVCRAEKVRRPLHGFYARPEDPTYRVRRHGTLTADELRTLLASMPEPPEGVRITHEMKSKWRRRLLYLLMATTLTRLGTLVEVTLEQFAGGHLHLRADQTKSRRASSKPLTPEVDAEVGRYVARCGIMPGGRPFTVNIENVYPAWKRDLANAGLRTEDPAGRILAPHSLKATGITLLIDQGLDVATVAELAEHLDVRLTLAVYKDSLMRKRPLLADHLQRLTDSLTTSEDATDG